MPAKIWTAESVESNHDLDCTIDADDNLTKVEVVGEVNYNGGTMRRTERLDIWPLLTAGQKTQAQVIYNLCRQLFTAEYLGT